MLINSHLLHTGGSQSDTFDLGLWNEEEFGRRERDKEKNIPGEPAQA